jgi:ubiquinone biosynthesis protein
VLSIKQDIQDIKRFKDILLVFLKEGFGYYIKKSKLGSHLKKSIPGKYLTNKEKIAIRLRRSFEKLGPTFVKLGQLLSLRPDLVPEEFSKEFEKLQDKVKPFPFKEVKKIIEEELKQPISKTFPTFSEKPVASASMAQVHKAKLVSGEEVAVKVQRPNIKKIIDTDLDILFLIAYSLKKKFPEVRNYRPIKVVKEFALWTRRELDFRREIESACRLKEVLAANDKVYVPKVYTKYSTSKLLVTEFIDGKKLNAIINEKKQSKKIIRTYFFSILEQALLHGFFHADPHPANIFVKKSGKLVFLDFGIVGELSLKDRKKVIEFVKSLPNKNADESLDIVVSLAKEVNEEQLEAFKDEVLPILRSAYSDSIKSLSVGKAFYKIISLGAKNGVIFDSNHVLMAKAIYQAEGLTLKLYPEFNIGKALEEFREKFLLKEYNLPELLRKVKGKLDYNRKILKEFPDHVIRIIEKLERNPEEEHCEKSHKELEENLRKSVVKHRTSTVVLFLFIASLAFLYLEGKTKFLGLPISWVIIIITFFYLIYKLFSKYNMHWREEI